MIGESIFAPCETVNWKIDKMTAQDILKDIRIRLEKAGIEDFEYESWILLEWKCGINRGDYYMNPHMPVEEEKRVALNQVISKREKRIPLQYLMKSCEFMGYPFYVDERVLIPRQDTECLVEKAVEHIRKDIGGRKILDLCTGSGCIGISIKLLCPETEVTLADISEGALAIAGQNAANLHADVSLLQSDVFQNIPGVYDYIISNPPYIPTKVIEGLMPEVRDYEPRLALDGTEDGLYFYRKIIREASAHLKDGGMLFFEIGQEQGESLKNLLEAEGFSRIQIWKDLAGLDRIAFGRRPFKGGELL